MMSYHSDPVVVSLVLTHWLRQIQRVEQTGLNDVSLPNSVTVFIINQFYYRLFATKFSQKFILVTFLPMTLQ